MEIEKYQIIVIGAGAGGLVVAIGAAKAGKKVLLIEKGHYGGDCTNWGCIPSKTLIASAEKAFCLKEGDAFGIEFDAKSFQADKALKRVRQIIKKIRHHEEPEALEKFGVATKTGRAAFVGPNKLEIHNSAGQIETVFGQYIVIAAGSHPFIPPIEGLKETPFLTNETIFSLKKIPKRLGVLGAGPIGCELAQAFARLGAQVTLIASKKGILPREEAEVAKRMVKEMQRSGIDIRNLCETSKLSYQNTIFSLCTEQGNIDVDELLVSVGRRANIDGLDLSKGGIEHTYRGIPVDAYGRTNQKHIFAIGDIVGGLLFTHLAENHARSVLTTLLLPGFLKKKIDTQSTPRCTYTSPEVASVGLSEKEAREKYGENSIASYFVSMEDIDRAICCSQEAGFVKIVTKKWSSKILGATIMAPRAGEILQEISLAMLYKIPLRKLARLIHPYPVYSAAIRKCADQWLTTTILGSLKKKRA